MPKIVEIRNLEEIQERMKQAPRKFIAVIAETIKASLFVFWENVPPYVPAPATSTYNRTGTMGRTLGVSQSGQKLGQPDIFEVRQAVAEAAGDRSYLLLNLGFFTCGFHVAFITTHLPPFIDQPIQQRIQSAVREAKLCFVRLPFPQISRRRLVDDILWNTKRTRKLPDLGLIEISDRVDRRSGSRPARGHAQDPGRDRHLGH